MNKGADKKIKGLIFLKMWIRTGFPVLFVTIAALYLFLNFFLISAEMMKGHRVENIHAELMALLSNTELTDREAVENKLDLSAFHMAAVLFDPDGQEAARSRPGDYTEAEAAENQQLIETILRAHVGEENPFRRPVYAFGRNERYAMGPIQTPQGTYTLYCAGVSAIWLEDKDRLMAIGLGILAVMAVLTLLITWSCYKIYTGQQALEAAYSRKVNALAHNLKTPMMVLSGYSENLLAEIQTAKSVHYAEKILENVNQMNAIVDEVLEFTEKRH